MEVKEKIDVLKQDLSSIERDPYYADYVKLMNVLIIGEQLAKRRDFKIKQINELASSLEAVEKKKKQEVVDMDDLNANLEGLDDAQAMFQDQEEVEEPPAPVIAPKLQVKPQVQQVQQQRQVVQQVQPVSQHDMQAVKKAAAQEKVKEVLKYTNEELGIGDDIDLDFDV